MRKLLLSLAIILEGLNFTATAQTNASEHNFDVSKNLETFNAIYKALDMMYVDTLNADDVIGNGVNSMLRSLDPYTVFYPADKTTDFKMML